MRRKLGARKAIEVCKELWTWMLEVEADSVSEKWGWPKWKEYGHYSQMCPCCEFSDQREGRFCNNHCLLKNIWLKGCCTGDSPYKEINSPEHLQFCAKAIITECDRLLSNPKWGTATWVRNQVKKGEY